MKDILRKASVFIGIMTVLLGLIYPASITIVAQTIFPWQANGSIIKVNGKEIGSELIGQQFTDNKYFWSRPSSTTEFPYNAIGGAGSNKTPTGEELNNAIEERVSKIKETMVDNSKKVPVDLVTASGSGLDPHISLEAALYQVPRVAKERGLEEEKVVELVEKYTENSVGNLIGESRVNVLLLNLALDGSIVEE